MNDTPEAHAKAADAHRDLVLKWNTFLMSTQTADELYELKRASRIAAELSTKTICHEAWVEATMIRCELDKYFTRPETLILYHAQAYNVHLSKAGK